MRKTLLQLTITLIVATLGFIAAKTPLNRYEFELSAVLFILLFLLKIIGVGQGTFSRLFMAAFFTIISVFIVFSTNATQSSFFFLMYFLLFAISLLLQAYVSIFMTIYLMILFTFNLGTNQQMNTLLPIISLGFISPFALYLGSEYEQLKNEIKVNQEMEEETLLFMTLEVKKYLDENDDIIDKHRNRTELSTIKSNNQKLRSLINKFDSYIQNEVDKNNK